jgi:preprotein translocase subunit SecE
VARDRKRAKQRRARRVREGAHTVSPNQPTRADVPGALDHASAEVDEFDAALISGADGTPAPPEELDAPAEDSGELSTEDALDTTTEDALQEAERPSGGGVGGGGAAGGGGAGGDGRGGDERPSGAPLRGGNRVIGFLRASWAELHRVQWPDRRQVTQATAVVLGFVAIAGAYLGAADFVAKEIVELILG